MNPNKDLTLQTPSARSEGPTKIPAEQTEALASGLWGSVYKVKYRPVVVKLAKGDAQGLLDIERKVYERIGDTRLFARYLGDGLVIGAAPNGESERGLLLSYYPHGTLETLFRGGNPQPIRCTRGQQLRWAAQIISALRYLHLHSVIHGDLSIRNIALDEHFDFKLLDFGGSSIDGSEMLVECSPRYHRPHSWRFPLPGVDEVNENWKKPTRKIDTYALGTVLFEIFTWSEMYTGRQYDEVRRHATNREYPDLGVIEVDKIREVIRECWSEKYDGVDEIIQDLGTSWSDAREAVRCSLC